MTRFNIINRIDSIKKSIETYILNLEKLNNDKDISVEYKTSQILKIKTEFRKKFIADLEDLQQTFLTVRDDARMRSDTESLAFKPVGTQDEILYLNKKSDYVQYLQSLKPDELLDLYQDEYTDWRMRAEEEYIQTIMNFLAPGHKFKLKTLVEKRQRERLRDTTVQDLEYLEEKKGFLSFIERNIVNLKTTSPEVAGGTLHSFLGLAKLTVDQDTKNKIYRFTNSSIPNLI